MENGRQKKTMRKIRSHSHEQKKPRTAEKRCRFKWAVNARVQHDTTDCRTCTKCERWESSVRADDALYIIIIKIFSCYKRKSSTVNNMFF